jgi:hypothetical protein
LSRISRTRPNPDVDLIETVFSYNDERLREIELLVKQMLDSLQSEFGLDVAGPKSITSG